MENKSSKWTNEMCCINRVTICAGNYRAIKEAGPFYVITGYTRYSWLIHKHEWFKNSLHIQPWAESRKYSEKCTGSLYWQCLESGWKD